jgi:protein-S-isoprenylcysteine O-methyltransferase Ste14
VPGSVSSHGSTNPTPAGAPGPKKRPVLPPTYLAIAFAAMLVADFAAPAARVITFPYALFGLVPLAIGVALNLLADRAFKQRGTTVKPFEQSSFLVIGGVFARSRNPMYLGMVLGLLGIAILLGTPIPFAIVVVFALLLDRRFIAIEEPMLAETFGQRWVDYCRRVRRWL